ncbi:thioredoxin [Rhodobacter aestuarii]|uniref:Thioredoxin n=1 Tax=Rhodobacter aestuarii TaxID=453582 RepID=A0A1N7K9I4_9RHOB|nr:co-chaperone YbbN [Rhodobacter aestuarii]PTV95799.1 thioredoxin [Rhodobacter aestuarii]SIS58246.1 thioredoxin [Rhodobacter aestuarii]
MFGTETTPAQSYVKDVTEANFMAEVVDASMATPVIVDFWAPWCGPCKQLGPMLEEAVNAAKGKVLMAKINVDDNQRLAQALAQQGLPLQSIPTVVAFFEGRPVDMFQGAVPASQVKAFVEKLAALAGDGGLGEAIAAAEEMLAQGAAVDAAETFAAILGEEPENAEAYGGLVRAHLATGNLDQAEQLLAATPEKIATAAPVEAARAQLALAKQAAEAGPLDDLKAKIEANPDDHQARFDYATALHAAGQVEEAVEQLLELFRRDREWNEAAAKTQLFTIFDALKPTDPIVAKGRRRLSSMIFA